MIIPDFRRHVWAFARYALLLLLVAGPVVARAAGDVASISGRVVDDAGATVARADVAVRQIAVGFERHVETDADGRFALAGLERGDYVVSVTAPGFSTVSTEVRIDAADPQPIEFTLHPGALTEEVNVVATSLVGSPETLKRIPGSVDVIDRITLETSRVFNFSEALRKAPGITVRDEEGFGLRPNIGIRGTNPTRSTKVLLLEDGVPFTYAPYGDNATYYHPPIERFERIEILKGSGQIAYGPTTVAGVINYLTPDPPARPSGFLTLMGGNRDYFNGEIGWGTTWGRTGFFAQYLRKQGEGARESVRTGLDDFTLKLTHRLSERQLLTVKGNYYGEDSNVPYSGLREDEYRENPRANPFINDDFDGDRFGLSATHAYQFETGAVVTTSVYGQRFRRHWWRQSSNSNERPNDAADPKCRGMLNLYTTCGNQGRLREYYFWGVEPRLSFGHDLFGIQSETDLGIRFHRENQDRQQQNGDTPTARSGVLVENNERKTTAYSAFAQNRFLAGRLTVTPGLRVERIFYERVNRLLDVEGTADVTQFIPGIGVAYNLAQSTTIFAGVHRGFAPPRTEDIVNNTDGGAVDLDPELSWNYELGVRSLVAQGVRLDATFFRTDYENQIVPASVAGGSGATFTNGGETLHQGFELGAQLNLGTLLGSAHDVYFRTAYTFLPVAEYRGVRFSNIPGFVTESVTGNRLPYAPEHTLNAVVGYAHPSGVNAFLEAVHVSDQFADDLNTVDPTPNAQQGLIPAYTIWNATVNYDVESLRTTFFVTAKNLLDDTFIVDRTRGAIPGSPRLLQAGLKYRF